jgi:hypothetical protein
MYLSGVKGEGAMSTFWHAWRKEIIRGAALFCAVLGVWLFARYLAARVRQGVASGLPAALGELRSAFDPEAGGGRHGARTTGAPWTYRTRLAPQQWVWIRNTRGSITVEPAAGDSVAVTAVKTYTSGDTASVRLVAAPYEGGIAICAVAVGSDQRCGPDESGYELRRPHHTDVAVDFTVRLPRRARLGATTVLGDVHVTEAHAPLVLHTVSGDVDAVTTRGPVSVRSVNGGVRVRITAFGDTGAVSIVSINGSVTAELPPQLDADVEARTVNGSITTDYPLPVDGKFTAHELKGRVGRGGRDLHITTVNGSIKLKKAV